MISHKFYCFQPIQIKTEKFNTLLHSKLNLDLFNAYKADALPNWINKFDELNNFFNSIIPIKLDVHITKNELKEELIDSFKINNIYSLSSNVETTNFYLLFDYKLMYFILVYEIEFLFDIDLHTDYFKYYNNNDLYNNIRNMIVKEDNNSKLTQWASKIHSVTLTTIYTFLKELDFSIQEQDINIKNNTGNITNIIDISNNQNKNINEYIQNIIQLNNFAERLCSDKKPIILENTTIQENRYNGMYHFNGRFHTLVINQKSDLLRYIPIQFHMQYMWFYLKQINFLLEEEYDKIMNTNSLKNISKQSQIIDNLITKIEILILHNEKFKLAIEIDNELIYSKIQVSWNIENMLTTSNRYINYFKDYLLRIYNRKRSKVEQKQNTILLFISIFQFVALISVWMDYISIIDTETSKKASKIISLFGNQNYFELFNLYLPITFLFIIIFMIIYIYYNKE